MVRETRFDLRIAELNERTVPQLRGSGLAAEGGDLIGVDAAQIAVHLQKRREHSIAGRRSGFQLG